MRATESVEAGTESAPYDLRAGWAAVAIFIVLYALAYLDRKIISLLVDPIRESLGATDFQISILQGLAFVVFYTICALPIGWAVDRFSRRAIIFWGLITWSTFAVAGGFARTYGQLLFTRFGVGAGEASLHPAAQSALADLFPKHKLTGAMAIFGLGGTLGSALSLAIGGAVVGFAKGSGPLVLPLIGPIEPWQLVFIFTGAPGLALAFLVFLIPEPARRQHRVDASHRRDFSGALTYMLRARRFYFSHFMAFSLVSVMVAGFFAWMPTHLMRTFQLPVQQVGLTMGLMQLTFGAVGMALPGQIVDRMYRAGSRDAHLRYFMFGTAVIGAAGITAGITPSAWVAWIAVAVLDIAVGYFPVASAALQIGTPNYYRGQVTATFLVFYNVIGQGFGPSVVAGFSDFLFHDDKMIGAAMALTFALMSPLAIAAFAYGLKGMRRAVLALEDPVS